ncbi:LytTR family DNA-binding domain-containing protein [uncultured Eubacterium sp.]|uniref:LytR/AlgR family response regulator transcription factor n=1 Tax=uncultured Eubacterium sp. TaxID=165185 RepID=UPI0026313BC7|nr:LytTR family DNA-binding domain-containing protein [uncultured Eubacterium sp.]
MLRLAICDDNEYVVEQIESYIERIKEVAIKYEVYFSAEEFYKNMHEMDFDVYFLDIEIANTSGIELAEKIRKSNQYSLIVFITSHSRYALDVFRVNTFDFLLKPISFERFKEEICKIDNYIFTLKNNFVFMQNKNKYAIPCYDIVYIEKIRRKAYIHKKLENIYECNMTMDEIINRLPTDMFVKINRSCVVNMSMIDDIVKNELYLKNGKVLYIARDYKIKVKEKHIKYFL